MLVTIQYLRAASAALVVLFHVGRNYDISIPVGEGRISLFFIVSGFVFWWITTGSRASPAVFMLRRLARIVPLYWIVTTVLLVGSLAGVSTHAPATAEHYLKSMLFIPHVDVRSGQIFPLLIPGWTLVYEMFFAIVFALLLCGPERSRLYLATLVFAGLALCGVIFNPVDPVLATYTNEIMAEFLAGVWLAYLWPRVNLSKGVSFAILGTGIIMSFVAQSWQDEVPRIVYSGLPALLTIIGALGLERRFEPVRWLKRIGDSSYSIYLWHIPVIVLGSRILAAMHLSSPAAAIALLTTASMVAGLILYELLERPMTQALFGRIAASRPAPRPVFTA